MVYLPRGSVTTGDVQVHELAWGVAVGWDQRSAGSPAREKQIGGPALRLSHPTTDDLAVAQHLQELSVWSLFRILMDISLLKPIVRPITRMFVGFIAVPLFRLFTHRVLRLQTLDQELEKDLEQWFRGAVLLLFATQNMETLLFPWVQPIVQARIAQYSVQEDATPQMQAVRDTTLSPIVVQHRQAGWVLLGLRVMLAIGIFGFAIGTFLASTLTKDWGFHELIWPQIFRGVSLMFCMVPINNVALGTLPPERLKNASGLFNLTRNLGGAVGLALINTILNNRWDQHVQHLREAVAWGHQTAEETLSNLTQSLAALGDGAELAAIKRIAMLARREALVLALGDVFLTLTFVFLLMLLVLPAIERAGGPRGAGGGH